MGRTRFFKVKVITARSNVKSRSNYDVAQLHPLTNVPAQYIHPTPYGFRDMARTRFLRSRSKRQKVRSRSYYDIAQPYLLTNVPTKYQLSTSYGFLDMAQTKFYGQGHYQGEMSNQGQTMTLHNYTP